MYGYLETTTRGIEMIGLGNPIPLKNEKGKTTGQIVFNQFQMDMRPSLIDYLKQGW